MRQRNAWIAAFAGMACAAVVVEAVAHGGATGVVKERMDLMDSIGDATKSLAEMFKGKQPYDAGKVRSAATRIKEHSGKRLTMLFPEGSVGEPSEAKPEIWDDWQAFETMARELETYSGALANAADRRKAAQDQDTRGEGGATMMGAANGMMSTQSMMMGSSGGMMGGKAKSGMSADKLARMPADAIFREVAQTCNACHTRFRIEK